MTFFFTFHRKKKKRVLNVDGQKKDEDRQKQIEISEGSNIDGDDTVQTEKSDKLWASFLSDVGTRPKDDTPSAQSQTAQTVTVTVFTVGRLMIGFSLINDTDIIAYRFVSSDIDWIVILFL